MRPSSDPGPASGWELLPSTLSRWADWQAAHPDTWALDVSSGADGFDLETMSIVVELGPASTAFPVPELRHAVVANGVVNEVPVAVVLEPDTDRWTVFSRQLDAEVIELAYEDGVLVEVGAGAGAEVGGGRRFDPSRGIALEGGDENLDQLPGFTSFPSDYVTFFPDGAFWTNEGVVTVESITG